MPYTFYVLRTVLFSIHFLYYQIACTSLFSSSLTIMEAFLSQVGFSSSIKDQKGNMSCGFFFTANAKTFSISFPHFSFCTYAVIMHALTGVIHNDFKNIYNLRHK